MAAGRQTADDARCVGELEQAFRCWRGWYVGVLPSVARFSVPTCYRERLSEETESAAGSLSWSLP